ncbi:hypothetical protein [Nocardioides taihuensis]|uniref:Ig-like domain-containing protein n=1 Tax=Nocardioides taihuensis TaxID=1835606 RepID=A0ABW0BRX6_9ACTN
MAVLTVLALLGALGPALVPESLEVAPRAAAATSDSCLDERGDAIPCEFGLEPVTFPVGQTIGEYELGLLSRTATGEVPRLAPRDFAAGDFLGGCVPDQEACLLDNRIRVGARDPGQSPEDYYLYKNATPVEPSTNGGVPRAAASGDMALTRLDANGDGREELVYAAECQSFTGPSSELCLSLYDPAVNEYAPWQRTGLDLDTEFAPIRLAAGNIAQTTATVIGASFQPAPDGNGMFVTFTTDQPSELRAGEAVRFDLNEAYLLNESLCLTAEDGTSSCAGAFGEGLQAVEKVAADGTTFTVRVGSLLNASPGECPEGFTCLPDNTLLPNDWPAADCVDGCSVGVIGTSPGLAVAFAGPGAAAEVAAFTVRPSTATPFRLGDVANVGTLVGARKPLAITVGDLDGGLPDEIAVAHGTICSGAPCSQVRIFRWNDSRQLVSVRTQRLPDIAADGSATTTAATTESIDLAVGNVATSGNEDGADLVVGTVRNRGTTVVQELAVLDINAAYGVSFAQGRLLATSSGASQAIAVQRHAQIKVAADDVDGDGVDDPVVASTRGVDLDFNQTLAEVDLKVFGSRGGTDVLDGVATAIGPDWSGQIDLAVGQVGRVEDPAGVGMPNATNPDIVLAWTCDAPETCGAGTTGTGVAVRAFGVDADGADLAISAPAQATPVFTAGFIGDMSYSAASERSFVSAELADLDADSETLGAPVSYLTVGKVEPLLVLKSPPVHFDAFDGGSDGKVDGLISYNDTDDVNGCFALNKSDDCGTSSSYATTTSVDTSMSASFSNSWGVSGGFTGTAWVGDVGEDDEGDPECDGGVCAGLTLKLKVDYEAQQEDEAKAGRTFTYSANREVAAGADSAFAAVQTIETLEWPVYPGVSSFGANLEPGRYVRVDSPAETRFQWIDAHDPELSSSWWLSSVPNNVLSYPQKAADIAADAKQVERVEAEGTELTITTSSNHGWTCELAGFALPDGDRDVQEPGYLTDYPCAAAAVPVSLTGLTGPGQRFNGSYLVTEVQAADKLVLRRTSGDLPSGSWRAGDQDETNCTGCPPGSLRRTPGAFVDQDIAVSRGASFENTVEVKDESEFKASASWSIDTSLDLEVVFGAEAFNVGTAAKVEVGGHYKRSEAVSRTVQATSGTTFAVKIGSNLKTGTGYFVRPYLAADPVTQAMVLEWTADCRTSCTEGIWGDVYRRNPDLAFALPRLMTPFRDPNNTPYDLGNLLRSPDFQTWTCKFDADLSRSFCEPVPAAETGKPLTLTSFVHNYSLKPFTSQKPAKIRYFVGDPVRGGYLVTEITQDRTGSDAPLVCSGAAFCIPARDQSLVSGTWTPPPGLAGRGSPENPLAIYGVIKPPAGTTEIHPWEPVDLAACKNAYPLLDALHSEYYDPTSVYDDRLSRCPTTNNEGLFLQRFTGTPARSSDLSVSASELQVSADGSSLKLGVRSSQALAGDRVEFRIWSCARSAACSPATLPMPSNASPAQGLSVTKRLTIARGGVQNVTLPLGLPPGTRTLTVQVVPLDTWERPGGPGVANAGQLRNNVVTTRVTVG